MAKPNKIHRLSVAIMGWNDPSPRIPIIKNDFRAVGDDEAFLLSPVSESRDWDPFMYVQDTAMVIDAMHKKGFAYLIEKVNDFGFRDDQANLTKVTFGLESGREESWIDHSYKTAVCHSALLAIQHLA